MWSLPPHRSPIQQEGQTLTPLVALPLLAGIGLLYAVASTVYIRALNERSALAAAFLDALVTSFGFVAWSIMQSTGHENSVFGIASYCLGGSLGTYIIMRRRVRGVPESPETPAIDR